MKKLYFFLTAFLFFNLGYAQIISFPDANFKAKLLAADTSNHIATTGYYAPIKIDLNNDGEIDYAEAANVVRLDVNYSNIHSISGVEHFANLKSLDCFGNSLGSLNLVHPVIEELRVEYCQLTSLNVSQCPMLKNLNCANNRITALNFSSNTQLTYLSCKTNHLTSLDLSANNLLKHVACGVNQLTSLNVSGCSLLESMYCESNQLTTLNLNGMGALNKIYCSDNQLASIQFNQSADLMHFYCDNNNLTQLDLSPTTRLFEFSCTNNQLTDLDVSAQTGLYEFYCGNNQLVALDVSQNERLSAFYCNNNQLNSLQLRPNGRYHRLYCNNNNLAHLDLSILNNLNFLNCSYNQLTSLDVSRFSYLYSLRCNNNQLIDLNIKNGEEFEQLFDFSNNSTLQYVCADETEFSSIEDLIASYGYTNCHTNTYCSFIPGGEFYTIQGNNRYDTNGNGCDLGDLPYPSLTLSFSDGTASGILIPDSTGSYHYDLQAGSYTITPAFENSAYFTISPSNPTVILPNITNPHQQDFCITPNGIHNDLEIALLPVLGAIPGFDADYKIIYKNKGTTTQNGAINLVFDDAVLDFVSANPSINSQVANNLGWTFSNLQPFESREISLTLNLNSPLETPAVNDGDVLDYIVTITGTTDETPDDNTFALHQTVTNSFDPNDKTCLQGNTVGTEMIGEYVHYFIRFENIGTAKAKNIVVKDVIDRDKFDIATLVPVYASHSFETKITNGNKVEFIFENINLPFDNANNDGYVAFKIKTKQTLAVGDTFSNNANIYFDYNAPIITNTATTTIQTLGIADLDFTNAFSLSPVPTDGILIIAAKQSIQINSVCIYNTLGQLVQLSMGHNQNIDVSSLKAGNYFIKVLTDKGIAASKFIKK